MITPSPAPEDRALPPGQHGLAAVRLGPEVGGVPALGAVGLNHTGLPCRSRITVPFCTWPVAVRGQKPVAIAALAAPAPFPATDASRRVEVRARLKRVVQAPSDAPTCERRGDRRTRGLRSQPQQSRGGATGRPQELPPGQA